MDGLDFYLKEGITLAMSYGPKLILAIITLFVGLWVVKLITKAFVKTLKKNDVSSSLIPFLKTITNVLLKVVLVLSIMEMVGVEVTSFIAILGAMGLAVGLALSGTLQNFAGGVMILVFKPFKVGDFIEAQGFSGSVEEIQIFNTILKTPDNKVVIIPNAPLSKDSLVNYSIKEERRVDINFGVGYDDNLDKVKTILAKIIEADERILKDPAPFIAVGELADSSVNFVTRSWVKSGDYWGVYFHLMETVKKEFDKEGISIPYPQTDIHLHKIEQAANN